jgi:dTMP kinase
MNPAPPVTNALIDPGILAVVSDGAVSVESMRGLFVTLEGIDRSGKSTQAALLCRALGPVALAVREPGGTAVGEEIRSVLKDPALSIGPEAEALLFAAARAELVREVIRPALDAGRVVVCDRYLDSSLAYQGAVRGLGVDAVREANELGTGGLLPDLTLLLLVPPAAAAVRAGQADRFEDEGTAFQARVQAAYEELAAAAPERWRRIDASRPPERVHEDVMRAVERERRTAGAPA